jgi:hypothetical protein
MVQERTTQASAEESPATPVPADSTFTAHRGINGLRPRLRQVLNKLNERIVPIRMGDVVARFQHSGDEDLAIVAAPGQGNGGAAAETMRNTCSTPARTWCSLRH